MARPKKVKETMEQLAAELKEFETTPEVKEIKPLTEAELRSIDKCEYDITIAEFKTKEQDYEIEINKVKKLVSELNTQLLDMKIREREYQKEKMLQSVDKKVEARKELLLQMAKERGIEVRWGYDPHTGEIKT